MAKKPAAALAVIDHDTQELELELQLPAPGTMLNMDGVFYETVDETINYIKELVADRDKINIGIVRQLVYLRDSRLWQDGRDNDGKEFAVWTDFLKWACEETGIHKATFQRGLDGSTKARALGLTWDDISSMAPATIAKVMDTLTVKDPETGLTAWDPAFVEQAQKSGVPPLELARELVNLPKGQVLPAVRSSVAAPPTISVRARETAKGYEIAAWQDDLFVGSFTSTKKTSPDVIAWLERKLNITFIKED